MQRLGDALGDMIEQMTAKMKPELREQCRDAYYRGRMMQQAYNQAMRTGERPLPFEQELFHRPLRDDELRPSQYQADSGRWERSGLEPAERNWSLEYLRGKAGKETALAQAQAVLASPPVGWVVVAGKYGAGKSGILKSIVAGFIRLGVPARYINAARILTEVRSTYGTDGTTEAQVLDRYGQVRVLAIDEFDIIPDTGWAFTETRLLLDTRYNKRADHLTLIATNADPDKLPDAWGFMSSRMLDGERIRIGGADLRDRRGLKVAR